MRDRCDDCPKVIWMRCTMRLIDLMEDKLSVDGMRMELRDKFVCYKDEIWKVRNAAKP